MAIAARIIDVQIIPNDPQNSDGPGVFSFTVDDGSGEAFGYESFSELQNVLAATVFPPDQIAVAKLAIASKIYNKTSLSEVAQATLKKLFLFDPGSPSGLSKLLSENV